LSRRLLDGSEDAGDSQRKCRIPAGDALAGDASAGDGVAGAVVAGGEPGGWVGIVDALVGAVTVVVGDPGVDRGLDRQHRGEGRMVVEQFAAQALVEPLDLPGRGR
jgi:hypothetical protein